MKNYYEILEVNENASKEVIDKAYKVLAKKYHPDLQEEKNKKAAEEKIKSLNEAYEILSNPKKKQAYDAKIARLKQEEENRKQVEHQNYVNNISNVYARQYTNIQREAEKHNAMNKQFKKEYNKELRKLRLQGFIRKVISKLYDEETGATIRIQYGGSVKVNNIEELMSKPNIDGALIGGASLVAEDFIYFANVASKLK